MSSLCLQLNNFSFTSFMYSFTVARGCFVTVFLTAGVRQIAHVSRHMVWVWKY